MQNPFKYGDLSHGEDFCNRKMEIRKIQNAFKDGQNIIIVSPRRWGKSSLVEEAVSRYRYKAIMVFIDCFRVRSEEEFYTSILKNVLKASDNRMQELIRIARKFLGDFLPSLSFTTELTGEISINFSIPKGKQDPGYILDLAQKIAIEKKRRVVVCIDEFQKISEWRNGDEILERLRSHWMHHNEVCYCLYGSKRHLMEKIFSNSSEPFFRFGEMLFLKKIGKEEWVDYILEKFMQTNKKISEGQAIELVRLANGHTYYILYISRICWNICGRKVQDNEVRLAYDEFINDHNDLFVQLTDTLTRYQINYLKAFSSGETQFTSKRVLHDYDIGTAGNIKRIEKVMKDLEIIDYYTDPPEFADPFFETLFKRRFM